MSEDRAKAIDRAFLEAIAQLVPGPARPREDILAPGLTCGDAYALFKDQIGSRHLDLVARELRGKNQGFYTIGSSGHEGNACVAMALRPTDPALLHYRSGAFYLARARQAGLDTDPRLDVLLGMVASTEEPIAGGRHKVFGNKELAISPQTSTIASHLPRAVGLAFAIERAAKLGIVNESTPRDAIVMCSFGDASINHSTAVGALNAASHTAYAHFPLPVLFVCEDNGIGISVPTPEGWVEQSWRERAGMRYFRADGGDLVDAFTIASEAARYVRERRRPALLHLRTVRLMGHAGSDLEISYRTAAQIRDSEALDPLIRSAQILASIGARPEGLRDVYEMVRAQVAALAEHAISRPRLTSKEEIIAPLSPRTPDAVAHEATRAVDLEHRRRFFGDLLPENEPPAPLCASITRALGELLVKYPEMLVFGEDVGKKGGVYGVTRGLAKRASVARVFDTLLDEQTILGLALGAGQHGLLPFPEIQYLAYLHNAEDQLRGEAASLSFFSQAQYKNPMVVRIQGLAYQKGFGGHFHNDNAVGVLRDIPGIVIGVPSRGDDAAAMLHACAASAKIDGSVCVMIEPIALYHTRDLYDDGDGLWCFPHRPVPEHVPVGVPRIYGDGTDLTIATFGNGVLMCKRVARRLAKDGIHARVVDLRWLAPLPIDALMDSKKILIADETRRSGGVSEGIVTGLVDRGFAGTIRRVSSEDTYIPLGDAANLVLLSEADIERAARDLV